MSDPTNPTPGTPGAPEGTPAGTPPVTPPVTPPAPATPPIVNLDPAPAPATPPAPEPVKIEPTGDPGLDLALEFIAGKGIKLDDPAVVAAKGGDFSLIEAKMAALGEGAKGWEKHLALAKQAYERQAATTAAAQAEVGKIAVAVAGDPARWEQVRTWAAANASPEERAYVNNAFASGDKIAAKMAAQWLVQCFDKKHGKAPAPVASPAAGSAASGTGGPYTARQYSADVAALVAKSGGRDVSNSPEYRELQTRRLTAMRAGH